jgi:hypothetical protein
VTDDQTPGDLRQRYAEALARWALMYPIPAWKLAGGYAAESLAKAWGEVAAPFVTDVRDDELGKARVSVQALGDLLKDAENEAARMRQRAAKAEVERDRLRADLARLQALTATCTCPDSYETYAGPEAECPVHGAVQALNEVMAEVERLRTQHAANVDLIADLDDKRAQAYDDRDEWAGRAEQAEALLREAETVLVELGACDDPGCTTEQCSGLVSRIRALLAALDEPEADSAQA